MQEIRIVNEQNGFGLLRLDGLEFQSAARSFLAEHLKVEKIYRWCVCHIKCDFPSLEKPKALLSAELNAKACFLIIIKAKIKYIAYTTRKQTRTGSHSHTCTLALERRQPRAHKS